MTKTTSNQKKMRISIVTLILTIFLTVQQFHSVHLSILLPLLVIFFQNQIFTFNDFKFLTFRNHCFMADHVHLILIEESLEVAVVVLLVAWPLDIDKINLIRTITEDENYSIMKLIWTNIMDHR